MKISQLKLGALLSYVTLLLSNIIGIIYTPIMLRLMGQSEYGLYSLVASVVGYLTVLDMGLGNAIIRYIAKYRAIGDKEEEYSLNGMFLILYTAIGIVVAAIGILLSFNVKRIFGTNLSLIELEKAQVMMVLLVFNLAVSFPLGIFGSIMTAYEKFIFPKVVNIIRVLINPCIMIPLLLMGYKSVTMVVVTTLLNLMCLLLNMWYCFNKLKIRILFKKYNWSILKDISSYSFFIFLNIIVDKIYWSTDQFILGMVSGTVSVAIYTVASQLNAYYMNFSTAMSGVFLPKITVMVSQGSSDEELSDMFIKIGRLQYILLAFILSGFILFGKQFIGIWAGEQYQQAFYMALVIMIPLTIPLIQTLGITILQAKNMHAFRSNMYAAIAIINIVISINLAKVWDGFGCALATGISMLIGHFVIMNIYYHKKVKLQILMFWKEIFKLTVPVFIAMLGGLMIKVLISEQEILSLGISIVLFSLLYLGLMWRIGMNEYEKGLFSVLIKAICKRGKTLIIDKE